MNKVFCLYISFVADSKNAKVNFSPPILFGMEKHSEMFRKIELYVQHFLHGERESIFMGLSKVLSLPTKMSFYTVDVLKFFTYVQHSVNRGGRYVYS